MTKLSDDEWLARLTEDLERINRAPDTPQYDVEWLLRRCRDTMGFNGRHREDSIRDLRWDTFEFHREFPGLLSPELVPQEGSWTRRS